MGIFAQPFLQQDLIENNAFPQIGRTRGFFFGLRTGIDNTKVDLWEGPTARYVFPSAPMQMQIVSTSANDTAAGTGVRTVTIDYLDANYIQQTLTLTLNGTTPVLTTPTDIFRVNYFHAVTVGSIGNAVGSISLQSVGGAVTYDIITASNNISFTGIFTVPANAVMGYISHWQYSSGSAAGSHFTKITIEATCHRGELLPGVFITQDFAGSLNNGDNVNYPTPIKIPPLTDIRLTAVADVGGASVTAFSALSGFGESARAIKQA